MRNPEEFIMCPDCNGGQGTLSACCRSEMDFKNFTCEECGEYCEVADCETCDGCGEVHPSDLDTEPDGDFQYDTEKDLGL